MAEAAYAAIAIASISSLVGGVVLLLKRCQHASCCCITSRCVEENERKKELSRAFDSMSKQHRVSPSELEQALKQILNARAATIEEVAVTIV